MPKRSQICNTPNSRQFFLLIVLPALPGSHPSSRAKTVSGYPRVANVYGWHLITHMLLNTLIAW